MTDVAVTAASGSGIAYGVGLYLNEGQQTMFRVAAGGYARINGSTQLWSENGETMPGVDRHNTLIPFLPSELTTTVDRNVPILIRGGRDFILDLIVYDDDGEVQDITDAVFIAQIRRYRYSRYSVVQMEYEILDGPTGALRLRLRPDATDLVVRCMLRGKWDMEMQLDGIESTVVEESPVRVLPGISRGTMVGVEYAIGTGEGEDIEI